MVRTQEIPGGLDSPVPCNSKVNVAGETRSRSVVTGRSGFTLIELMIVIAIIAVLAAIAVPSLLAAQRASNERNASASLKTFLTSEADFRANDRDGNGLADFWTLDVFGLYGIVPLLPGSVTLPPDSTSVNDAIRLMEPSIAGADGASFAETAEYGNVTIQNSVANGAPKANYIFRMFANQDNGGGATTMRTDTDGPNYYGDCHDFGRFAVAAFPIINGYSRMFMVSQDGTMYRYDLPPGYTATYNPMGTGVDSTSSLTGTGQVGLDDADTFPAAPEAFGCAKLD